MLVYSLYLYYYFDNTLIAMIGVLFIRIITHTHCNNPIFKKNYVMVLAYGDAPHEVHDRPWCFF